MFGKANGDGAISGLPSTARTTLPSPTARRGPPSAYHWVFWLPLPSYARPLRTRIQSVSNISCVTKRPFTGKSRSRWGDGLSQQPLRTAQPGPVSGGAITIGPRGDRDIDLRHDHSGLPDRRGRRTGRQQLEGHGRERLALEPQQALPAPVQHLERAQRDVGGEGVRDQQVVVDVLTAVRAPEMPGRALRPHLERRALR